MLFGIYVSIVTGALDFPKQVKYIKQDKIKVPWKNSNTKSSCDRSMGSEIKYFTRRVWEMLQYRTLNVDGEAIQLFFAVFLFVF